MNVLKLQETSLLATQVADKYRVRSYVRECIGDEYLTPVLALYKSVDEIDFNELPDKFALKTNI